MKTLEKYEAIIGLEIHAQLLTRTKAYSSDENSYGDKPNTKTSPISLGHPGTLPVSNKKVIDYTIKMGLACNSKITNNNEYARKNYFYADLPKGYQITQDSTPICNGGHIIINKTNNLSKKIHITRIHMEEDAGKSIHELDPFNTLIDLNRAGVPLIEIVSEPEIRNSEEAYQYIQEVRKILRYLDICDGNMEEGNLRCDANISVKLKDSEKLGTKVEVKNMNSSSNVKKAIEYEIKRQIQVLENKEEVTHETRSYDALKNTTISMRHKEKDNDYRYFPEPDLQPIIITKDYIEDIKEQLPLLPNQILSKLTNEFGLSQYDSMVIIEDKNIAYYALEILNKTRHHKAAANIIIGPIKSYLNMNGIHITNFPITPRRIVSLIDLIHQGKVSNSIAISKVFPIMIQSNLSAEEIALSNNWIQDSNADSISEFINQSLEKYPEKVEEYKSGKKGLIGLFMGEIMKLSKGKADPKLANKLLKEKLEK